MSVPQTPPLPRHAPRWINVDVRAAPKMEISGKPVLFGGKNFSNCPVQSRRTLM